MKMWLDGSLDFFIIQLGVSCFAKIPYPYIDLNDIMFIGYKRLEKKDEEYGFQLFIQSGCPILH